MLPVSWTGDGPMILPDGVSVPLAPSAPGLPAGPDAEVPLTGNFTWRDEFDGPELAHAWNMLRTSNERCYDLGARAGSLTLRARKVSLRAAEQPSFVGRRQQHARFTTTAAVRVPEVAGVSAGLTAFQNESHHFFLAVRVRDKKTEVYLERVSGAAPETMASAEVPLTAGKPLQLRIDGDGRDYSFSYAASAGEWATLKDKVDGSILSTSVAGGFVGTYLGLHARLDP